MSIDTATIAKISLNKKDQIIASKTINCRKRCFLDKRFKTIQKIKQKRKKKKNKLLALKNYILVYIIVFDNNILFK